MKTDASPALLLNLNRPKYHQSEIKTFLMCGLRHMFRYQMGVKTPSSAYATTGSAVDTSVNHGMTHKVKTGEYVSLEEAQDVCVTDFNRRANETIFREDEKPGDCKDAALAIIKVHHGGLAQALKPKTVQQEFVVETDAGFDVGGTIDITEEDGTIRDTKTASRQRAGSYEVNRSLQPALYDYAYTAITGKQSPGWAFDIFTRPTKTLGAEYKPQFGKVTAADHEWLFNGINQVHKAIKAGVALPAPEGSWYCSEKWCEYWHLCKGKK